MSDDGRADDMIVGLDDPCLCGHRHAEHSAFGVCRGCTRCDGESANAHHDYEQCTCTSFTPNIGHLRSTEFDLGG